MASFAVEAIPTDVGRQRMGQDMIDGYGWKITRFAVGSGGHDQLDPTRALTPDTSVQTLPDLVFGPEDIDDDQLYAVYCPQFLCVLEEAEAIAALSNIGIYATMQAGPEVGTEYLYAIGNFPLKVKTSDERIEMLVTINV
jgi:hypothetical protein